MGIRFGLSGVPRTKQTALICRSCFLWTIGLCASIRGFPFAVRDRSSPQRRLHYRPTIAVNQSLRRGERFVRRP